MQGGYPMNRRLHFPSIWRIAAARGWVIRAMYFYYITYIILDHMCAFHEICIAQANFVAGIETIVFWRRRLTEIVLLDVKDFREWNLTRARSGIFRVIDRFHLFDEVIGVIVNDQLKRLRDRHTTR